MTEFFVDGGATWQSWMASPNKGSRYDPWYVKVAFGLFLFVLVGVLVALYVAPYLIVAR
jgi:hypothetical protein